LPGPKTLKVQSISPLTSPDPPPVDGLALRSKVDTFFTVTVNSHEPLRLAPLLWAVQEQGRGNSGGHIYYTFLSARDGRQ